MTPPADDNTEAPEGAIPADRSVEDAPATERSPKRPSPRSGSARATPRSGGTKTSAARARAPRGASATGATKTDGATGGAKAGAKKAGAAKAGGANKAGESALAATAREDAATTGAARTAAQRPSDSAATREPAGPHGDAAAEATGDEGTPRGTTARRAPARKAPAKGTRAPAARTPKRATPARARTAASKPAPEKDVATEPSAADRDLSTQPVPVVGPQVRAVVTSEERAPAIFKRSADADEGGGERVEAASPDQTADAGETGAPTVAEMREDAPAQPPVPSIPAAVAAASPAPNAESVPDTEPGPAPDTEPEPAPAPDTEPEPEPNTEPETARAPEPAPSPGRSAAVDALRLRGVVKAYGGADAVYGIDLTVPAGSFYGIVGPNGAGKTTTLSMISGLLRPDAGTIEVFGIDLQRKARAAKALIGVLPDRLRTFDRLTGRQLLYYFGVLRGLTPPVVAARTEDLARAFDIADALGRVVADYSAGMRKKVMLAGALIHSPRLLVLDEPFEAVDPVSAASILEILSSYVSHGGTVVLSSHGMELVESVCTRVAVIVSGQVLAEGTVDEVRGEISLEQRFVELSAGGAGAEGLEWLHRSSD